jgi:hypothetical protein
LFTGHIYGKKIYKITCQLRREKTSHEWGSISIP